MKCNGKTGYLINLKKEYGDRANSIITILENETKVQSAFIADFANADFMNITKILLYMIKHKKVKTEYKGMFIDKEFSHYFTLTKKIYDSQLQQIDEPIQSKDYRRIHIKKQELTNPGDIINHNGNIEPVETIMYYLNPCSVLSVHFLDIQKEDHVLDLCAAPGGKSIIIASRLFGYPISQFERIQHIHINEESGDIYIDCNLNRIQYSKFPKEGTLVVNEMSKGRYKRLEDVIAKYIPKEIIQSNQFHITNHDGTNVNSFLRFTKFHKILLDAPCSSDAYLFQNSQKSQLSQWSEKLLKNNSTRQFELLVSAFQLLRPKGIIIYSTCALSKQENDQVIERFLKVIKRKANIIDFVEEEFRKKYEKMKKTGNKSWNICSTCSKNNTMFLQSGKNGNKIERENNIMEKSFMSVEEEELCKDVSCDIYQFYQFKENNKQFLGFFEKTKYGYISLPDKSPFGILFMCKIQKQ